MKRYLEKAASSPVAFNHPSRVAWTVVRGDEMMVTGTDVDWDFILVEMTSKDEIKNRGRLGNGPTDAQNIDVLGRMVRLHSRRNFV